MNQGFPTIRFRGELRPSQRDVVGLARRKLAEGKSRLHIVAPPGSGKTVMGLYLWAECVCRPALVLSPNSAIQAQWAERTDLFEFEGDAASHVSTDPQNPSLLTSLTYQAVTLPHRGDEDLDSQAYVVWQERLVEKGQAKDLEEARVWIDDLRRHNVKYFEDRFSAYRKEIRDAKTIGGEAMATLHASSLATIDRLRRSGIGLIVLDECHHLLGHWGRVLADVHRSFDHPVIVGLTATPPDRRGKLPEDVERYDEFFGPVDYEVPVPAVVKDGFLAPYQDLVQFVRPLPEELTFIATADRQLKELVEDLCAEPEAAMAARSEHVCEESLPRWVMRVVAERRLPTGAVKDWASFEKRDPAFAAAARLFLAARGLTLPAQVPPSMAPTPVDGATDMSILVPVLDRYIRHRLRTSSNPADHALGESAVRRLRVLGVQVTETGPQACTSPVSRVLMYSRSKMAAMLPILEAERRALGDRIRVVVVADFERTSAVLPEVDHLLNEEAGGAIAAFRTLLGNPTTDELNPILVTGSSVLVDDDLANQFHEAANEWLTARAWEVAICMDEEEGFHVINGQGPDWCPRVYVAMITELFQRGLTKCLVGTRGLLGEGWDATKVNVLVDLTTVTTSTSVNQLRGRSLRLDPDDPGKLADNWDVVCVAPEFTKGLDDYARFLDKHNTLYGLTDDGAVEKGVGHVHAAFTEIKPEGVEGSMAALNEEMLQRPFRRPAFRDLWRIGEPYHAEPIQAVEVSGAGGGGFPPFRGSKSPWNAESLTTAISEAILRALRQAGLVSAAAARLQVGSRAGGYVRAFLRSATEQDGELFSTSLQETLGPLDRPRYVIPRYVDFIEETWLSRLLPQVVARYFRRSHQRMQTLHAVPSALAKNKDLVAIFQRHWNALVSHGDAVFAQRGDGADLVDAAKRAEAVPQGTLHRKEIFV